MKFSLTPPSLSPGNSSQNIAMVNAPDGSSDFNQWLHAMKMVARLPGGMPPEFRKKLWLALSDKHIQTRGFDWTKEEVKCLSDQWRTDDEELGIQIVKVYIKILSNLNFYSNFYFFLIFRIYIGLVPVYVPDLLEL